MYYFRKHQMAPYTLYTFRILRFCSEKYEFNCFIFFLFSEIMTIQRMREKFILVSFGLIAFSEYLLQYSAMNKYFLVTGAHYQVLEVILCQNMSCFM
jgi:hypothetical protein